MRDEVLTGRREKKGLPTPIIGSVRKVLQYRIPTYLLAPLIPNLGALYFPTVQKTYKTTGERMGAWTPPNKVEWNRTTWKCSL